MDKMPLATRKLVMDPRGSKVAATLRWLLLGCAPFALGLVACSDAQDSDETTAIESGLSHTCGNHVCQAKKKETCSTCPQDCGPCTPACGDGTCSGTETCSSCPQDCGSCSPACGDGSCNGTETCSSCPQDCGSCSPACGDGSCNGTETCSSCAQDCGSCPPACGDGSCNGTETCSSCAQDCGSCPPACGDDSCNGTETCNTCPQDCGACGGPIDTAGIPNNRLTPWNPGILSDGLSGLPLDADGLPQRTTVCATLAPGANIQNAINSCPSGQVVVLGPGTFNVSSTIPMKAGVVLRGSGSQGAPTGTTVVRSGGGSVIAIGSTQDGACYSGSVGSGYALTQDAPNGSVTVKVGANASQFAPGNMAYIDQADDSTIDQGDCPYFKVTSGRSAIQRVEIAAVDTASGTLTLSSPLHWNYKTAASAKLAKVTATITKWAGVESLRIGGGTNPGYLGQMAGGIDISNAAYSWVKDVQTGGTIGGMHIAISGSYRIVVRDSYVHHSASYGYAQDCYGVVVRCGSSENLIENNIVRYMNKPILFNTSGGGNVVGYNYVDNAWAQGTWQETPIDCHCSFPHMELMEGNFATKMGATITHGNAGYLMYLRNYSSSQFASPAIWNGSNTITSNVGTMIFGAGDIGMTAVGNVLGSDVPGTSGASNGYISGSVPIYIVASAADVSNTTFLRHGNYDYFNDGVIWDPSVANHTIPVSLYRTQKPAFFGAKPWPWAGSDLSPMVGTLPAKARSDANYSPPAP